MKWIQCNDLYVKLEFSQIFSHFVDKDILRYLACVKIYLRQMQ